MSKLLAHGFQHRAHGAGLLHAVLTDVQAELPDAEVYLNAQLRAVPFYERHGFWKEEEVFEEANIQHYRMGLGGVGDISEVLVRV